MARQSSTEITETQESILEFIEDYIVQNSRPPTYRDIQNGTKPPISSLSMVKHHLNALEEGGHIEYIKGSSRGVWVSQLPKPGDFLKVPLCGVITCGAGPAPTPDADALRNPEDWVTVARGLIGRTDSDLYALRAKGDSMIDAMINDGDLVILRKTSELQNGGLYAVFLNDKNESSLKRVYQEGKRLKLKPENPTLKPFYVDARHAEIQGKVVCVVRQV
jgi:repressor LexA